MSPAPFFFSDFLRHGWHAWEGTKMSRLLERARRNPVYRSLRLDSLESRQLLAGFSLDVNFQPAWSTTPAGYVADTGKSYSYQGSNQFGWNTNNTANVFDRWTSADDRRDTFAAFGNTATTWEVAVPNGQYQVTLLAGDPTSISSYYSFKLEGHNALNYAPNWNSPWTETTTTVTVADGKLTLTGGSSSWNNKINSISIRQLGVAVQAPATPSYLWAWGESNSMIGLQWPDVASETGYVLQRSVDGVNFGSNVTLAANTTRHTVTGLSAGTKYHYRIIASNASGNSAAITASASTHGNAAAPTQSAPAAPTYISSWADGANAIVLDWQDVGNEQGYGIERSTDGWTFTSIATTGANQNEFTATNLAAGTKYYFRVHAFNAAGKSATVSTSSTTAGNPAAPPPPSITAPTTPAYLWSWATGSTTASLQWANVTNEAGYKIERSTDGASYTQIAIASADSTIYNATGLAAGTKYFFRVSAYNAGGSSAFATTSLTTSGAAPAPNPTPGPTSPPSNPNGINQFALSGIVQNEVPYSMAVPALNQLGMKSVRLWYSINSWHDGPNMGDINRALEFKNAGFTVTLALVSKTQTDAGTAKAYFQRVAANSTARNAIDYWEIGNEMNLYSYWNGSLNSYVSNYLKPAYEAIHPYGELVVGGGVTWDVNAVRTLVAAGYNNYCDYANFHPYGESGDIVIQRARDAKAAFGNKPMMVTEWNVQFITDLDRMAAEVSKAGIGLSHIAYMNYYFALRVSNTHVGQGGAINMDGSRNTRFWNVIYNWVH